MQSSTRAAMRLLSPRLQYLQRKPGLAPIQIRQLSSTRYSNPTRRSISAAPAQQPSFLGLPQNQPEIKDEDRPRNPLDDRAAAREWEEKRQYHLRRMRFAGLGLLMTFMGLCYFLYSLDLDAIEKEGQRKREGQKKPSGQQLDASSETNQQFHGKEVHVIGAGDGKRIVAQGQGEEIELVETGTSSVPHFPRTIYLPTSPESSPSQDALGSISVAQPNSGANAGNLENQEQFTLVGLGIRTVSFFSIQVYVVGLYIRTTDISALQEKLIHAVNETASTLIPAEKEELKRRLLDPKDSREIWTELLKVPGLKTAWRIAPTRSTDFAHLRDGWITGISNRTREARQLLKGTETEYDAEDFGTAVGDFKNIFAGGKAPKGSVMILSRGKAGGLDVWFQAKPSESGKEKEMQHLGSVSDERIGKLIWLGYLGGEKVSSEAARQGVVDGCVAFAGRPVGSVESMVT